MRTTTGLSSFFSDKKKAKKQNTLSRPTRGIYIAYLILFSPMVCIEIVGLIKMINTLNVDKYLTTVLLPFAFFGFALFDIKGRYIALVDGEVRQRTWFLILETLDIADVVSCKMTSVGKIGASVLRLETGGGDQLDVNPFHFCDRKMGTRSTSCINELGGKVEIGKR